MNDYLYGSSVYGDDIYVDDYYMDEKWAAISGIPGYMVSNKGRVWSERTQKFLKVKPMDAHGHLGVCLMHDGGRVYRYIHRLVAEAFIPNPDNLPVVRHLYDNPEYNSEEELAWGTQRDNAFDAMANGRAYMLTDEDRERSFRKTRTPIKATNVSTGESFTFKGQSEAGRTLRLPQANIWKVLNGQRPHAGGYYFEYVGGDR